MEHQWVSFGMQATIDSHGVMGSRNPARTIGLGLEATGGYNIFCVSDGSTIDNSGCSTTLDRPDSLDTFQGACGATLNVSSYQPCRRH